MQYHLICVPIVDIVQTETDRFEISVYGFDSFDLKLPNYFHRKIQYLINLVLANLNGFNIS